MAELAKVPIEWDLLLKEIQNERCILLLGPDLVTLPDGYAFQHTLHSYLKSTQQKTPTYYEADEFFSFRNNAQKRRTYYAIQDFYAERQPGSLHRKLAEIPFHLIISLSPDTLLQQTFNDSGLDYQFDFYKKGQNPAPLTPPHQERPLIYNLIGSAEDDHSLVFTYEDLFEYLQAIFGHYDLPDTLREGILNAQHLVFLGIQYEKWYLKLLLRLLNLHENKVIDACSQAGQLNEELLTYYTEHFEIVFIETEVQAFVDQLHERCAQKGFLRKGGTELSSDFLNRAREMLGQNQTREALKYIEAYIKKHNEDFLDDATLISSQISELEGNIRLNLIDVEEAERKRARINQALLNLATTVCKRIDA